MSVELAAFIVVLSLGFISLLIMAWHLRFQIIGLAILVASAYLLISSDMFLVIRVPTVCIVGLGVLLALFTFIPRPARSNQQGISNH